MANTTPIITIDVNDDAFKAFQASFDKFKKVVEKKINLRKYEKVCKKLKKCANKFSKAW